MDKTRVFTYLWNSDYCQSLKKMGVVGEQLRFVWGGHNQRTKFSFYRVKAGDYIMPLRAFQKNLYVIAGMKVKEKVTRADYLKNHPSHERFIYHDCATQILIGEEGTPIRFDMIVPGNILEQLSYVSQKGKRKLKHVKDGELIRSVSLEGVYRLSTDSADALISLITYVSLKKKASYKKCVELLNSIHD